MRLCLLTPSCLIRLGNRAGRIILIGLGRILTSSRFQKGGRVCLYQSRLDWVTDLDLNDHHAAQKAAEFFYLVFILFIVFVPIDFKVKKIAKKDKMKLNKTK